MKFQTIISAAASLSVAAAQIKGFNTGSTKTDGSAKTQADFESEFAAAKVLAGTSGFTNARLYTTIQGGTTNTPISAIPAAIAQDTGLLLGLWASGGEADFANELAALTSAITQYGTQFTSRVLGISVGSEDLYRTSTIGIAAMAGVGTTPDVLVTYINQLKSALASTSLSTAKITHVDTYNAWTNGSNAAVISAVDFLSMDVYPYFQSEMANSIDQGSALFNTAYDETVAAAQGKDVWVTETGWPVSGPNEGAAVASVANAKTYWDEVGCNTLFGKVNTFWYILQDAQPTTPSPSFGLVGSGAITAAPLFNLTCPAVVATTSSSSVAASTSSASSSSVNGAVGVLVGAQANTVSSRASALTTATGTSAASSAGRVGFSNVQSASTTRALQASSSSGSRATSSARATGGAGAATTTSRSTTAATTSAATTSSTVSTSGATINGLSLSGFLGLLAFYVLA